MASRTINTILNLRDNMSGGIVRVSRRVNSMSREAQRASRQVANMANTFKKKAEEMANRAGKFAVIGASIAGAFALKTGLSEAMDLEGFRMQLETATKDTKKAADIMKYSIDLANKTPFEGGELVQGASKLEAMGLSAKKWLPLIGDMAAATNKPFDQAIEAFIDSQTGELERLKEFGITKAKIAEKAAKLYKGKTVINNKGQIVDFEKFNNAMVSIMQERYTGGMEKQANTMKGLWSTVTGVTKSALSEMVGMTSDGTIRQGSLLDKLKEKVKQLASTLEKWQSNGTLAKVSKTFTDVFTKIYEVASKVFNFIKQHEKLISTIAVTMVGFSVAIKIASALKIAILGLQVVWGIFNSTLALTPLGWVVIGITALIAAGYALWRNWDTIKSKGNELWTNIKLTFDSIKEKVEDVWIGIKNAFKDGINWIIDKINFLTSNLNKVHFTIPGIDKKVGFDINQIDKLEKEETNSARKEREYKSYTSSLNNKGKHISAFATGTQYFKGGLAEINEHGGEIVNLPNGSKVIPADKSQTILNKNNPTVINVNIQGNVVGNEGFADYIATIIAKKINSTAINMA